MADDDLLDADLESLEDVFDDDALEASGAILDDLDEATDPAPNSGVSWAFDFLAGRFIVIAGAGPIQTRGEATLRGWIEKCLRTGRDAHPIHLGTGYGLEPDLDIGGPFDGLASLEERVREALTFHPRISDVTDFEVEVDEVDDEAAQVSFTVIVDEGDELELDAVLRA